MYVTTVCVLDLSDLLSKLQLLTISDENPIVTSDIHPRISTTGRVASNDEHAPAFRMNVLQSILPRCSSSSISLRGLLPTHTVCRRLFRRVPQPGTFLSFTGVILALNDNVPTIGVEQFTVLPYREENAHFVDTESLEEID